jgi:nucleoside phosphorylase
MNPPARTDGARRVRAFADRFPGALDLARHAALPVVLDPDLVHFLRTNFFLDAGEALPYTAEADLLFSPLCREVGEGLYEMDPEVRDVLLAGLVADPRYGRRRLREVATLLWQYSQRSAPWADRPALERAQQLTALNFLDPPRARDWLAEAESREADDQAAPREWFVAMRQSLAAPDPEAILRGPGAVRVNTGRLPTPVARELFVGRQEVIRLLDAAWADGKVKVVELVAEGGVGKSALIWHWLDRMRTNGYPDCEQVIAWSFYSQGGRDHAADSRSFLAEAARHFGSLGLFPPAHPSQAPDQLGRAIGEAFVRSGGLMILDGVEPLQYPPETTNSGSLGDVGLSALLTVIRGAPPPGARGPKRLLILSTRWPLPEPDAPAPGALIRVDLSTLSDEDGALLLKQFRLHGVPNERLFFIPPEPGDEGRRVEQEFKAASREVDGNPLALVLLASYLLRHHGGDLARRRDMPLIQVQLPLHATDVFLITTLHEEWHAAVSMLRSWDLRIGGINGGLLFYSVLLPGEASTFRRVILPDVLDGGSTASPAPLNDAIRRLSPRCIMFVGVGGGVAEEGVRLGDVLIADRLLEWDARTTPGGGKMPVHLIRHADPGLLATAQFNFHDFGWVDHIQAGRPDRGAPALHIGPLAVGTAPLSEGALQEARGVSPRLLGVRMRGGIVLGPQGGSFLPFFVVQGVSDLIGGEPMRQEEAGQWRSYACDAAVAYAIHFLQQAVLPAGSGGPS